MKFKLRELSPIIVSIFILSITIIGITSAFNNGSIGGLFYQYTSNGWDYNLIGSNGSKGSATTSGYRLNAKNIFPTNFGITKTIKAGSGVFSNKVTSANTIASDPNNILVTKKYIQDFANAAANNAKDNLGNHIATQDLNMSGKNIIGIGNMYDNNSRVIRDALGGWVRTYGTAGWYNGTYGGGWHMTDTTWLRAYGDKSIYTAGSLLLGGKANTAPTTAGDSLNTLTTKGYVDSKVSGISGGGGIIPGNIILNHTPGYHTWVAPNNISYITIIGCGGGGGGARDNYGGGGGGCAEITAKVTPGRTYSYVVGSGGSGVGYGTGGGKSSFASCTLGGGGGGTNYGYTVGGAGGGGPWGGGGAGQGGYGGQGGGGVGGVGGSTWNGRTGTISGLSLIGTNGGNTGVGSGGKGGNACTYTIPLSAGHGGSWSGSAGYGSWGSGGTGKYGCNGGHGGSNYGYTPGGSGCIAIKPYLKVSLPNNSL